MNILVISASMRKNSQSLKVSQYLADRLVANSAKSHVLDLHELNLPIFDDGETTAKNHDELVKHLMKADGYVFVTPEWNGMMSHGLINMLHYAGNNMAHKPVMGVAVSSGRGGHYPLIQMRQMGYKNRKYVITPESLVINYVKEVLNDDNDEPENSEVYVKRRAEYALKVLIKYAEALKIVRSSKVAESEEFPHGV